MSSPTERSEELVLGPGTKPEDLSLADIQRLMNLAVLAYGRLADVGREGPILPVTHAVTATDAARVASALLAAVNLEVFELALWETWGGRPWWRSTPTGEKAGGPHA
jgi:hypothetical protein